MKVLIDCTQITRNKAGVGMYALNLVNHLVNRQNQGFQVVLLVQDDDPDFCFDPAVAKSISVPSRFFRILPLRLLMEQLYIPWIASRLKVDVIHSLHYSFPLMRTRARRFVTIHDMTSFIIPEVHTRAKRMYFHFFIRAATYLADCLIFDSNSTRSDWADLFPGCAKPVFVTLMGKSEIFKPDLDPQAIRKVLDQLKISTPYVLFLGTIEPRKNLLRLVSSFARIADLFPLHHLVIAGMKGWMYDGLFELVAQLKLEKRIVFTGFVAEGDKPYLINGADAFAYLSLYEGFGIPVLEALACGIPTLTSNTSSLLEVAGDAALLADPTSIDSITFNLRKILSDTATRQSLRSKSLIQAARFDWGFTADQTMKAYTGLGARGDN